MTEDEIKKLKELCEKAPESPCIVSTTDYDCRCEIAPATDEFYHAAREAIPRLIEALEKERSEKHIGDKVDEDEIKKLKQSIDEASQIITNWVKLSLEWKRDEKKLKTQLAEAQAAQAHTASCNIELMRKLDKATEVLKWYADKDNYRGCLKLGTGEVVAKRSRAILKEWGIK